jgi:hypothetical protein
MAAHRGLRSPGPDGLRIVSPAPVASPARRFGPGPGRRGLGNRAGSVDRGVGGPGRLDPRTESGPVPVLTRHPWVTPRNPLERLLLGRHTPRLCRMYVVRNLQNPRARRFRTKPDRVNGFDATQEVSTICEQVRNEPNATVRRPNGPPRAQHQQPECESPHVPGAPDTQQRPFAAARQRVVRPSIFAQSPQISHSRRAKFCSGKFLSEFLMRRPRRTCGENRRAFRRHPSPCFCKVEAFCIWRIIQRNMPAITAQ